MFYKSVETDTEAFQLHVYDTAWSFGVHGIESDIGELFVGVEVTIPMCGVNGVLRLLEDTFSFLAC